MDTEKGGHPVYVVLAADNSLQQKVENAGEGAGYNWKKKISKSVGGLAKDGGPSLIKCSL